MVEHWFTVVLSIGEVERLLREYRQNQELVRNIGAHYYQIIYPVQLRHHEKMGISTREIGAPKVRKARSTVCLHYALIHSLTFINRAEQASERANARACGWCIHTLQYSTRDMQTRHPENQNPLRLLVTFLHTRLSVCLPDSVCLSLDTG